MKSSICNLSQTKFSVFYQSFAKKRTRFHSIKSIRNSPLAVAPGQRAQGVDSALMNAALENLRAEGAKGAVLVGDPAYYGRFGFASHSGLTVSGAPENQVLALPMAAPAPCCEVIFHAAFNKA